MFKSVSRVLLSPPPNPVGRVHPTHRLGDLLTFTAALLFSAIAGHLTYLNWTPVDVQLFTFPARVPLALLVGATAAVAAGTCSVFFLGGFLAAR